MGQMEEKRREERDAFAQHHHSTTTVYTRHSLCGGKWSGEREIHCFIPLCRYFDISNLRSLPYVVSVLITVKCGDILLHRTGKQLTSVVYACIYHSVKYIFLLLVHSSCVMWLTWPGNDRELTIYRICALLVLVYLELVNIRIFIIRFAKFLC